MDGWNHRNDPVPFVSPQHEMEPPFGNVLCEKRPSVLILISNDSKLGSILVVCRPQDGIQQYNDEPWTIGTTARRSFQSYPRNSNWSPILKSSRWKTVALWELLTQSTPKTAPKKPGKEKRARSPAKTKHSTTKGVPLEPPQRACSIRAPETRIGVTFCKTAGEKTVALWELPMETARNKKPGKETHPYPYPYPCQSSETKHNDAVIVNNSNADEQPDPIQSNCFGMRS